MQGFSLGLSNTLSKYWLNRFAIYLPLRGILSSQYKNDGIPFDVRVLLIYFCSLAQILPSIVTASKAV